jgi:hypothetical protein
MELVFSSMFILHTACMLSTFFLLKLESLERHMEFALFQSPFHALASDFLACGVVVQPHSFVYMTLCKTYYEEEQILLSMELCGDGLCYEVNL